MKNHRHSSSTLPVIRFLLFTVLFLSYSQCLSSNALAAAARCKNKHPSDEWIAWKCERFPNDVSVEVLFGEQWKDVLRFNRIDRRHLHPGTYLKVPEYLDDIRDFTPMPHFYTPAEFEAKYILIDLREQFMGAYEYGQLAFSCPITSGEKDNPTPTGEFRITAYDRNHKSSLFFLNKTDIYYPMQFGLRFYVNYSGIGYWIHGRDLPGHAGSHGCVGLYDEAMQKEYYKFPKEPELEDARKLFEWVTALLPDNGRYQELEEGPKVMLIGHAPGARTRSR